MCINVFQLKEKVSNASEAAFDSKMRKIMLPIYASLSNLSANQTAGCIRKWKFNKYQVSIFIAHYSNVMYDGNRHYNLKMFTLNEISSRMNQT